MDIFSKRKRSEIMSQISSRNTKIESVVFCELRRRGIYFQRHYKKVVGSPDVALPRRRIAIFIDGDFWHGYKYKKLGECLPEKFWKPKIEKNIIRDKFVTRNLRRAGWKVMRVWEHEVNKNLHKTVDKIYKFILDNK